MRNLCLDIGNSLTKVALFDNGLVVEFFRFDDFSLNNLELLVKDFKPDNSIISSVAESVLPFESLLKETTQYKRFTTQLKTGVKNYYKSENTLGLDRWAGVIAANALFKDSTSLVIDAGTCITYDVVTAQSEYFGGSISPGINMRFKALNAFAARLPLVAWDENTKVEHGTDTKSAILNGVLQGALNEVEGFIALNDKKHSALNIIITGGDANFLFKQLQNSIFAPQIICDPFLVLKGLNEVLVD